jgi:hypothetical protein
MQHLDDLTGHCNLAIEASGCTLLSPMLKSERVSRLCAILSSFCRVSLLVLIQGKERVTIKHSFGGTSRWSQLGTGAFLFTSFQ